MPPETPGELIAVDAIGATGIHRPRGRIQHVIEIRRSFPRDEIQHCPVLFRVLSQPGAGIGAIFKHPAVGQADGAIQPGPLVQRGTIDDLHGRMAIQDGLHLGTHPVNQGYFVLNGFPRTLAVLERQEFRHIEFGDVPRRRFGVRGFSGPISRADNDAVLLETEPGRQPDAGRSEMGERAADRIFLAGGIFGTFVAEEERLSNAVAVDAPSPAHVVDECPVAALSHGRDGEAEIDAGPGVKGQAFGIEFRDAAPFAQGHQPSQPIAFGRDSKPRAVARWRSDEDSRVVGGGVEYACVRVA